MDLDIGNHSTLSTKMVFDGKIVKVYVDDVSLPDGREARWERVVHPGAVGMVPITGEGAVILVRQYRHAVGEVILEIPAGKLEKGEEPESCAQRELAEEIGYQAGDMVKLAEFYNSPGFSDEYFHLFLARELEARQGEADPDEFLSLETVSLEKADEMIRSGKVRDAKTIIGILLARSTIAVERSS